MKVLITGVAGFIGSHLAKRLLKDGIHVIGIDNLTYGSEKNIADIRSKKNFQFVFGDITNPFILKEHKAEIVVHLASQKIPRYNTALRTLEENSLMIRNIVNKCVTDNSKLVFASTSDVYGKSKDLPFHEDIDLVMGPTYIKRWAYALSKIYSEQYIIANHEEYGIDFCITRFFGTYGPFHNLTWWGGPQSVFIAKALKKEPIEIHGDGKQTRTFTYIDDNIEALTNCILDNKANNEIFNIGSNPEEEISILDLGKLIWKLVNGPDSEPQFKFIPYKTFGKYEDVERRVPCIDKIKKYFQFEPRVTLEDGLRKTIEWQKKFQEA